MKLIIINLLLVGVMILPGIAQKLSSGEEAAILDAHNRLRGHVNPPSATNDMKKMTYDEDLARVAQAYADKCTWGHNGQRTAQVNGKYTYVGENVYATTKSRDAFDVIQAVQSWYSEVNDYNFERNSCTPGKICGHYTQVVWADSDHVGCGARHCDKIQNIPWKNGGTIVVCDYGPGGNYRGVRPYKQATSVEDVLNLFISKMEQESVSEQMRKRDRRSVPLQL